MKLLGKYALVIVGGLLVGAALVVVSFVGMDFVWTHFVSTDPAGNDLGDGIMVVGGGFAIGSILGLAGLIFMLYRFWPKRMST